MKTKRKTRKITHEECLNCGYIVQDEWDYCPQCGEKLNPTKE